jgi:hypothetical protein
MFEEMKRATPKTNKNQNEPKLKPKAKKWALVSTRGLPLSKNWNNLYEVHEQPRN